RHQGRSERYDKAVAKGRKPLAGEDLTVPTQGVRLGWQGQVRLGVEGYQHDDQNRQEHESVDKEDQDIEGPTRRDQFAEPRHPWTARSTLVSMRLPSSATTSTARSSTSDMTEASGQLR